MNCKNGLRRPGAARRRNPVCSTILAALLTACNTTSRYATTAMELTRTERLTSFYRLSKAWKPLGESHAYTLSDDENARVEFSSDRASANWGEVQPRARAGLESRANQRLHAGQRLAPRARGTHRDAVIGRPFERTGVQSFYPRARQRPMRARLSAHSRVRRSSENRR